MGHHSLLLAHHSPLAGYLSAIVVIRASCFLTEAIFQLTQRWKDHATCENAVQHLAGASESSHRVAGDGDHLNLPESWREQRERSTCVSTCPARTRHRVKHRIHLSPVDRASLEPGSDALPSRQRKQRNTGTYPDYYPPTVAELISHRHSSRI